MTRLMTPCLLVAAMLAGPAIASVPTRDATPNASPVALDLVPPVVGGAMLAGLAPPPELGLAPGFQVAQRSRCERLRRRLARQRDDNTLNAQDSFNLRRRGC